MICKCKNCGSATKYDSTINKMVCDYCDSTFEADELNNREYIEYNVYACSSCGGELRLNSLEASTFCPYCGQPSIAFSRISKEIQPDVIIPFSVSKEEAVEAIRKKFRHNIFIPRAIRNFSIDKIRGIYIPFWIFDVNYKGRAIIKTKHGTSKNRYYYYHYRNGECNFTGITADASKRLNDESSQRLEPFDLSKALPFNANYLSGFYADRYDVEDKEVEEIITSRATEYFEKEMLSTVSGSDKEITESKKDIKLGDAKYAFLPVWFLTFRYKDKPYTFLVNGQTKKVIGGVPYVKAVALGLWAIICALLYYPSSLITNFIWDTRKEFDSFISMVITISIVICFGIGAYYDLSKANDLTTSKDTKNMVANREEEH